MSLKNREKIYYQNQTNWCVKNYNALYFILNKAIIDEQQFLGKIDYNLLANSTKAIIKALVNYYSKYEIYEIFPNLSKIQEQKPLSKMIIIDSNGLKNDKFKEMGLIN